MRNLLLFLLFMVQISGFAQKSPEYLQYVQLLKKDTQIDPNDKTVINLLDEICRQVLHSDEGMMDDALLKQIETVYTDPKTKNIHLLRFFLVYQDYITHLISGGDQDTIFQLNIIMDLEQEIQAIYGYTPEIVEIYKSEALDSDGRFEASNSVVEQAYKRFPNSVILKIYRYLDTQDPKLKQEIIAKHANHWMVKDLNIK